LLENATPNYAQKVPKKGNGYNVKVYKKNLKDNESEDYELNENEDCPSPDFNYSNADVAVEQEES